jgi:hypothetical protein
MEEMDYAELKNHPRAGSTAEEKALLPTDIFSPRTPSGSLQKM